MTNRSIGANRFARFYLVLLFLLAACSRPAPGIHSIMEAPEFQDAAMLDAAWKLPVAATYKAGFEFQKNGSICGPTTAQNALRSLGVKSANAYEIMKRNHLGYFGTIPGGVTLDELADILRKEGDFDVQVVRDINLAQFRDYLRMTTDVTKRILINFTRHPLFAQGGGHHSPVGGYFADKDLVFVLDTNENYKPWLVKADRLYEAMNTDDMASGKKRGLIVLSRRTVARQ